MLQEDGQVLEKKQQKKLKEDKNFLISFLRVGMGLDPEGVGGPVRFGAAQDDRGVSRRVVGLPGSAQ